VSYTDSTSLAVLRAFSARKMHFSIAYFPETDTRSGASLVV